MIDDEQMVTIWITPYIAVQDTAAALRARGLFPPAALAIAVMPPQRRCAALWGGFSIHGTQPPEVDDSATQRPPAAPVDAPQAGGRPRSEDLM